MKKFCSLLALTISFALASAQNQWTWFTGDQSANGKGVYGTKGVAGADNSPGSRAGASTWTDKDGNFWLFGGVGKGESSRTGLLNDLWKFNPSSKQWTWVGGSQTPDQAGSYGTRGVASASNIPGGRQNAMSWTDSKGNFWLFGGMGFSATSQEQEQQNNTDQGGATTPNSGGGNGNGNGRGNNGNGRGNGGNNRGDHIVLEIVSSAEQGLLNDLWMYSPSTGQWTWVSGSVSPGETGKYGKRGEGSTGNFPGGRYMSTGWKDAADNIWLFGGRGYSSESNINDLDDVWKYSPANHEWTWMSGDKKGKGDDHYGKQGEFNKDNSPGGRRGSTAWMAKDGMFWLFGGGTRWDIVSDVWKYDPDKNQWAWVGGKKRVNQSPVYRDAGVPDKDNNPGSRAFASGLLDKESNLWLFGGEGYGGLSGIRALNNLWRYAPSSNEWAFMKGDADNRSEAVFGTRGQSSESNTPGGLSGNAAWRDKDGNLWVFGGESPQGYQNAMWKFAVCGEVIKGNISPANASICEGGSQVLTASGGTSYEWKLNNQAITGATGATITATKEGTYTVLIKKGACAAPASNNAVISKTTSPTGTISPANVTSCGDPVTLTATGGNTYTWMRDGVTIAGQTSSTINASESGTYSVIIQNGTCTGPASNTSAVIIQPGEKGTRYRDVTANENTPTQLSAREIGVAYQWSPADGLDNPSSVTPKVTTSTTREYIVHISTEQGCTVTDTVLVKIKGPVVSDKKIDVPTAFSPNGNGVNDILRPLGDIISINYFRVFNRWGQMLFQTNIPGAGWDGKFKGLDQPAETYTWLLSATTSTGETVKISGKTLLIR
jgi:gliding motility-associated-like protein